VTSRGRSPRWSPALPRFPLIGAPSPLQPMPRFTDHLAKLTTAAGRRGPSAVWIKREDLLPVAFGGNKLRNLEFLLGEAIALGADCLVTSGRRWSNHCRLTAASAVRAGLEAHLVLTGPRPRRPGPNQVLAELYGAHVRFTDHPDRAERRALVERVVEELRSSGRRPYFIDVGGSSVLGAIGQVVAGLELVEQSTASRVAPDLVIVPSATGGTQAGLAVGLVLAGSPARVTGFAVSAEAPELRLSVERLVDGLVEAIGVPLSERPAVMVDGRQLGPGYGKRTPESDEAARLLARTEAIVVDPIYTAKALAGLIELARTGDLADRTVVFWHAGGTIGVLEQLDDDEAAAILARE
jgi:1-aminocyclopropane-1-carboxylate deaminase/D-cysteine desulfhydrase-like pyridoxal-dependent ACC family enzyme